MWVLGKNNDEEGGGSLLIFIAHLSDSPLFENVGLANKAVLLKGNSKAKNAKGCI